MENESDLEPKYGIVAMVDALGMRSANIDEAKHFINKMQTFENKDLLNFMSGHYNLIPNSPRFDKFKANPPQLTTFGDTLIFSWEISVQELSGYIADVGVFLSYVVIWGLENKIAFRGAVSVGHYIKSGATVLGPAISDVAAWHDYPEMIGIVVTPFFGQMLSGFYEDTQFRSTRFIRYDVPTKGSFTKNLWAIAWPNILNFSVIPHNTEMEAYYLLVQKFAIPKGTEDKYLNTEIFAKWVLDQGKT